MKMFLSTIVLFAASVASAKTVSYQYECDGKISVRLEVLGKNKAKAHLKFPGEKNGVINIVSDSMLHGSGDKENLEPQEIKNSIYFTSFEYPNGDAYMVAENDTREEGFTFAMSEDAMKGAQKVQASTLYWSEWSNNSEDVVDCTRK